MFVEIETRGLRAAVVSRRTRRNEEQEVTAMKKERKADARAP